MTRDGSFKKVVRRHAEETGQRYTDALTDLEDIESRLFHEPTADRLIGHLRDRYGIDAVAATKTSQHNDHVFRIDQRNGDGWIARVFPPARSRASVEGDAAILRFLALDDDVQPLPVQIAPGGKDAPVVRGEVLALAFILTRAEVEDIVQPDRQ